MVLIREAVVDDAESIARCHVLGWQEGCRGVLPDAYLASLSLPDAQRRWQSALAQPDHGVVVAELPPPQTGDLANPGSPVVAGFARIGATADPRPQDDPIPGELRELYLDPAWWGTAVSAALHQQAIANLVAGGFSHAVLWVVVGNERAERFYRRRGWRADGWRRQERSGPHRWEEKRLSGSISEAAQG